MILTPLATYDDLLYRNIKVPSEMDVDVALSSATDAVRDAAGCAISESTSTVTLVVDDQCWVDLPAGPVSAVTSVVCGSTPLTFTKVGDSVRILPSSWPAGTVFPVEVQFVYTHGLPQVPADIVDLICSMVAIAGNQDGDPGSGGKLTAVRLGNYSETYRIPVGTESPSPFALPDTVKNALRARFGSSAVVVGVRR